MKYPVGNGTKVDYLKNWYIASSFGEWRGTYYHSGIDLNLKTGGNTDLGKPINAILDGKVVYYHNNSHPTTGYGRHNVYEVDTKFGKRWVHCAHNQSMIASVKDIKEGDEVAKIGNSGTKYAHLHLSIYKVDPKTLSHGIDTIPRTKTQLNAWYVDPVLFLEALYSEDVIDAVKPIVEDNKEAGEFLEWMNVKTFDEAKAVITQEKKFLEDERKKTKRLEAELEECKKLQTHMGVKNSVEGIEVWDRETEFLKQERTKTKLLSSNLEACNASNKSCKAEKVILENNNKELVEKNKFYISTIDELNDKVNELVHSLNTCELFKHVLINDFDVSDNAFESEKAFFDAIEEITRGENIENVSTDNIFKVIWSRFTKALDSNK
ncbi:MAG: peptidoglycan DD-metalloendopeptidase family protein [Halanaerobiales bacterium]|nr:peptidoglycan DD-metalloendopeptidase family protein [Halanaerobiales bacterium]